ncbi:MAG TPA: DUF2164 family protein [Candidatus Saccharimonadales bacterium]|nr:DUF2164 family protein [Candidatus Saccharimonadales bacterium]
MQRKWDVSDEQTRKKCIDEVITRIQEQDGEAFGRIVAEEIIAIVLQNIGADIYNLGVEDARKLVQQKFSDLEIDLDLLSQNND